MSAVLERVSTLFGELDPRSSIVAKTLMVIGVLWSSKKGLDLFEFIRLYFFRRSSFDRYVTSSTSNKETWALVTGASDGIGKGFAEELCSRGVNVVLHGRNEAKLQRVRDELQQRWSARKFRILTLDAGDFATDAAKLDEARDSLQDINLRILINNVGGPANATRLLATVTDRSCADDGQIIDTTARFGTEITRVLLPQLIKNQPSLVISIGSIVSLCPFPYFNVYSAAKAYLERWSTCLSLEMEVEKHDVEVLCFQTAGVNTAYSPSPVSFFVADPRYYAKCGLYAVGCGRRIVYPYWPHALQFGTILSLPNWVRDMMVVTICKEEIKTENKKLKAQKAA